MSDSVNLEIRTEIEKGDDGIKRPIKVVGYHDAQNGVRGTYYEHSKDALIALIGQEAFDDLLSDLDWAS